MYLQSKSFEQNITMIDLCIENEIIIEKSEMYLKGYYNKININIYLVM